MKYSGVLYRALNPVYARASLSSQGAALFGGRFNPKGLPALYTSLSPETAIREANQVGTLQPTTLVAYRADIENVFDSRDISALEQFDMTRAKLGDPAWRNEIKRGKLTPTQAFAKNLLSAGFGGLLVTSFARGATSTDLNLVIWLEKEGDASKLVVVDDEDRLGL